MFVLTRKASQDAPAAEQFGNVPIRRIPPAGVLKGKGWRSILPLLELLVRIAGLLAFHAREYDLLLVSGLKVLSIPAILISKLFGKCCVLKSETPIELREDVSAESLRSMRLSAASLPFKLLKGLRNAWIRQADCIIAISPEIREQLLGIGVAAHKICSIPNGIDPRFSPVSPVEKQQMRQALNLPADALLFVFTGRLTTSKAVMMLIQVWKGLAQKHQNIHLLLLGSGSRSFDSCEEELKEFIRTNRLGQQVSLPGEVENVPDYLKACDVFVFPSDYEGFGLALVEALACGLPTVATRVGVAEDLIQNRQNGLLIPPKDPAELQAALELLLETREEWTGRGRLVRQRIVEEFSMDVVASRYQELFERLCSPA